MLSRPIVKAISGERVGMVQVFSFFSLVIYMEC